MFTLSINRVMDFEPRWTCIFQASSEVFCSPGMRPQHPQWSGQPLHLLLRPPHCCLQSPCWNPPCRPQQCLWSHRNLTWPGHQRPHRPDILQQIGYIMGASDLPNMSAFAFSYSVNVYDVSTTSLGEKSLSPSVVITCRQNKRRIGMGWQCLMLWPLQNKNRGSREPHLWRQRSSQQLILRSSPGTEDLQTPGKVGRDNREAERFQGETEARGGIWSHDFSPD